MTLPPHNASYESFVPDASNQRLLRDALGCFGTGVTIITAATDNGPAAIAVNSFASVSLTPPLVLWSLDRQSSRYEAFNSVKHYCIHVLTAHQEDLCMRVARDADYLKGKDLSTNHFNVPVLNDCLVRFDCTRETSYSAGDHVIILGRVELASQTIKPHSNPRESLAPLAFYQGNTGTFIQHQENVA